MYVYIDSVTLKLYITDAIIYFALISVKNIYIYIYIYIERERERERV